MGAEVRLVLGLLLGMLAVTGCGAPASTPTITAERECQRASGTWRGGICDFSAGGGY